MQHADNQDLVAIWQSCRQGEELPDVADFDTSGIDRFRGDLIIIERRGDDYFFADIGTRVAKALQVDPDRVSALDVYVDGMRELVANLYEVVLDCPSLMVRYSRFRYGDHRRRVEMLYLPVSDGNRTLVYILCSTFYKEGHGFVLNDSAADFEHILALDFMPLSDTSPLALLRDSSWLTLNYMNVVVLRDGRQVIGYSGKAIEGTAARAIRKAIRPQMALVTSSNVFDSLKQAPEFGFDLVEIPNLNELLMMMAEVEIDIAVLDSDNFCEGESIRLMDTIIEGAPDTGFLVRGEYGEDLAEDYPNVAILPETESGLVIGPTMEKMASLKVSEEKSAFMDQA